MTNQVLAFRIPEENKAYEVMRNPVGDIIITVHDDGKLHLWIGSQRHIVIEPDGKDLRILDLRKIECVYYEPHAWVSDPTKDCNKMECATCPHVGGYLK